MCRHACTLQYENIFMNQLKLRKRIRWQGHDYSENGYYFVTICTKGKECWFGEVADNKMMLNNLGTIVERCLLDLPNHYKNCRIEHYVIMPNHVHAVLFLNNADVETGLKFVVDRHACPLRNMQLLPCFVGSFKSAVTKQIHELGHWDFAWQRSFHDRVIRSDKELAEITEYIYNNPVNWKKDKYY